MKILTLDFETFYDTDYSLTKLTNEEYIRDPRFEIIGVGIKVGTGKSKFISGTREDLTLALLAEDITNCAVCAHNSNFDLAILNWILGIRPKFILDTLSMARGLHGASVGNSLAKLAEHYKVGQKGNEVINAKGKRLKDFTPQQLHDYGAYCKNDVDLTYELFLKMAPHYNMQELRIIDLTVRMFTEPVLRVDRPLLEQHLIDVKQRKQDLLTACGVDKKDLMSNDKFAGLLRAMGVEPPTKISKTTGKEAYAFAKTDEGFKALLEHDDERVQILAAARVGNKSTLEEKRTERFIGISKRGLIPVPLQYCGAHTSRWGGCLVADTEILVYNLQNGVEKKRIVDVLLDDLVWDGESFVQHEGVVFSGYSEVIEWDGVIGTKDHVVYTDREEISLREAMQREEPLKVVRIPTEYEVDAAREFARYLQRKSTV